MEKKQESLRPLLLSLLVIILIGVGVAYGLVEGIRSVRSKTAAAPMRVWHDQDTESLVEDLIHETGPGGEYLTSTHTLRHFRDLWQPTLLSRQRRDNWVADGKRRLGDRLREKTLALIESHQPESLDDKVTLEIAYILSQDERQ